MATAVLVAVLLGETDEADVVLELFFELLLGLILGGGFGRLEIHGIGWSALGLVVSGFDGSRSRGLVLMCSLCHQVLAHFFHFLCMNLCPSLRLNLRPRFRPRVFAFMRPWLGSLIHHRQLLLSSFIDKVAHSLQL